eukprot:6327078-Amphidinium_carterae.1
MVVASQLTATYPIEGLFHIGLLGNVSYPCWSFAKVWSVGTNALKVGTKNCTTATAPKFQNHRAEMRDKVRKRNPRSTHVFETLKHRIPLLWS